MKHQQCPICATELEIREVSPCWDCGHDPAEFEHLRKGKHTYAKFQVFGSPIVLCDFCMVDFSSYDPTEFGLARDVRIGLGTSEFQEVKPLHDPGVERDLFCPACHRRLTYLNWLACVRDRNAAARASGERSDRHD